MIHSATNADDKVLFNFNWTRGRIQQMHELSRHRGIAASAIIKDLLIQQFKADGIDTVFHNPPQENPHVDVPAIHSFT